MSSDMPFHWRQASPGTLAVLEEVPREHLVARLQRQDDAQADRVPAARQNRRGHETSPGPAGSATTVKRGRGVRYPEMSRIE